MLQCVAGVAVCCSALQYFAVSHTTSFALMFRESCGAMCWVFVECTSVLQCVAVCCSVLQCVAACCYVLQCDALCCSEVSRKGGL